MRKRSVLAIATVLIAPAYGGYLYARASFGPDFEPIGEQHRAPSLLIANGCAGCHAIPGIRSMQGRVGPPLQKLAERQFIAGKLANTTENLIRWIRASRDIDPQTAMPSTRVSEDEARAMAAYLYSR